MLELDVVEAVDAVLDVELVELVVDAVDEVLLVVEAVLLVLAVLDVELVVDAVLDVELVEAVLEVELVVDAVLEVEDVELVVDAVEDVELVVLDVVLVVVVVLEVVVDESIPCGLAVLGTMAALCIMGMYLTNISPLPPADPIADSRTSIPPSGTTIPLPLAVPLSMAATGRTVPLTAGIRADPSHSAQYQSPTAAPVIS